MKVCKEQAQATCLDYPNKCYLCEAYREQTNADRIRAMTDEELAKEAGDVACPPNMRHKSCVGENCYDCWLDWLQQPADHFRDPTKMMGGAE